MLGLCSALTALLELHLQGGVKRNAKASKAVLLPERLQPKCISDTSGAPVTARNAWGLPQPDIVVFAPQCRKIAAATDNSAPTNFDQCVVQAAPCTVPEAAARTPRPCVHKLQTHCHRNMCSGNRYIVLHRSKSLALLRNPLRAK